MSYQVFLAIGAGLWLAVLSFVCAKLVFRHREGFDPRVIGLMKQLGEQRIEIADLRDLYERLMTSHKRLRSSAGMAKLRGMKEKDAEESLATASEAEILRRLNVNRRPNR